MNLLITRDSEKSLVKSKILIEFELKLEGSEERRNDYLFEPLLYSWEFNLRQNIWSIIVLEYLIMMISDKFVRELLHFLRAEISYFCVLIKNMPIFFLMEGLQFMLRN